MRALSVVGFKTVKDRSGIPLYSGTTDAGRFHLGLAVAHYCFKVAIHFPSDY